MSDKNLFSYCDNNPVTRVDSGGEYWHFIIGGVVGGIVGGISTALSGGDSIDILIGSIAGIASGLLAASGIGIIGQIVGSVPQNFINRTFPKCPVCCSATPYWTISQHNQMSMKGKLYLFKCSQCGGIISMSMPDVTTLGNGGSGVISNPTVGLTNLLVKSRGGKEVGAVYAVIESVGTSGASRECEGLEFKLEHLQQISYRM